MASQRFLDPRSVAGKRPHVEETCDLLVIGAGPAGLAAAMVAVAHGLQVIVVDENPIPFRTMGEDVPLFFGGAMSPAALNANAMLGSIVASDLQIEAAFDANVDLRLGTAAYGLYDNGEGVGWLPGLVAGLVDGDRSWLLGCGAIIVAAGRRDMGLAFPGWDLPGVIGATAAERLATRYGALLATKVVLLGTEAEALAAALRLRDAGVTIAALVEQAEAPVGPPDLIEQLRAGGTAILCRYVARETVGRDRVEAVALGLLGPDGVPVAQAPDRVVACDAVLVGVGTTPVIDLLDSLGCRIAYQPDRGGYAPVLSGAQRTSRSLVWAAGDTAGIWGAKTLDPSIAEREGRLAAADAVAALAGRPPPAQQAVTPPARSYDLSAYRLAWVRASVVEARSEPFVCRCEEVTAREILEVRPPRYLGASLDRRNDRSLRALLDEGPPHPDQVKRLTRAGMGLCQGRRCREQVACLLALGSGSELGDVPLAGYRAPVRPLPLSLAADRHEPSAMTDEWDTWFAIPPQYRLASELPPRYTAAGGNPAGPVASE